MKHSSLLFLFFLLTNHHTMHTRSKKNQPTSAEQVSQKNYAELQKAFYTLQRSWDSDPQVYCKSATHMTNDEIIICYKNYLHKQNQTTSLKTPCFIVKYSKNLRDCCISRVSNKKKSPYGIIEIHTIHDTTSKFCGLAKTSYITIEQAAFKINPQKHGYHEISNYKRSIIKQETKNNFLFSRATTNQIKALAFPSESHL